MTEMVFEINGDETIIALNEIDCVEKANRSNAYKIFLKNGECIQLFGINLKISFR